MCVIIKIIPILGIKSMSYKNTKKIGLLPIHLAKLGFKFELLKSRQIKDW